MEPDFKSEKKKLEELIVHVAVTKKVCWYCTSELQEDHYASKNNSTYCNASCYTIFTDD